MNKTDFEYQIRRSQDRGYADNGWLKSHHTFSFAGYYDPDHMIFRTLRVINQDTVAPSGGFGTHPHQDMEIFSYVLKGELAHKDSMGNERILKPREVQLMSAGTGITHSEFNPSSTHSLHFLQIWILPNQNGLTPSYSDWEWQDDGIKSLLISPDGVDGSALIHQDAYIYRVSMKKGDVLTHDLLKSRGLWFQLISGEATIHNESICAGDAFSTESSGTLEIEANETLEALLFDLA